MVYVKKNYREDDFKNYTISIHKLVCLLVSLSVVHQMLKIHEILKENPKTFFVFVLQCIHKEKMFTINLGDGRKARKKGAKRLEFLVYID